MIFIGHGTGNKLHFMYGPNGETHASGESHASLNLNYTEAHFGSATNSRIKWLFAYTCNFLTPHQVTNQKDLGCMLEGAHMILGASSQMLLNSSMDEHFGDELNEGNTLIDGFFAAGEKQRDLYDSEFTFSVLYALAARWDAMFEYAADVKGYSDGENYGFISRTHQPLA